MANNSRSPGKKGLKPRDPDRYVLTVEHYLRPWEGPVRSRFITPAQALPPEPGDVDRESLVADWPMYVNGPDPSNPPYAPDGLGDCFWAGSGHSFTAQRVYAGWPEVHFSNDAIVTGYESAGYVRGDENTDQGTDPAQGLKFLHDTGLADPDGNTHKVAGYAFFGNPRNVSLMAQVLAAGGTVGIGFGCTQGYEDAFSQGVPCTWHPGDPVVGGHWVVLQRRSVGGVGVLHEITWGAEQRITRRYNWHTITDAAMIVSQDYIEANGVTLQGFDLEQLLADMSDVE
jgi:hypothetical protein